MKWIEENAFNNHNIKDSQDVFDRQKKTFMFWP